MFQEMLLVNTPWLPQKGNAKDGESCGKAGPVLLGEPRLSGDLSPRHLLKDSPASLPREHRQAGAAFLLHFPPAVSLYFKQHLEMASPLLLPFLVTQNVFVRFPSRQECGGGGPAHGPNHFQTRQGRVLRPEK